MTSLIALLQARAAADHGGSCYTWLDDQLRESQHLTVPELDRRARAIAAALQPFVMTGEPALLLYPPTLEFIAALFGCLYARVVAVPAYAVHGKRDLQRIAGMLHDARPAVVLTTASELENTRSTLARLVPDELPILATDTIDTGTESSWMPRDAAPDDLAYLQYTSGSTSVPRGVMVSHRNVLSNLEYIAARGAFGEDARSVCWLPHFHDMGLVYGILQPLFTGFPVYLMSPAAFIRTPSLWLRAISTYRGTHCGGPNFAYDLCARRADDALRATLDLRSWRVAFNGAEPVESGTVERFSRTFASCGFAARAFYPVYGLAEATLKVTSPQPGQGTVTRAVNADALARASVDLTVSSGRSHIFVGCGSASQGTRTVIVDPETRQEAAGIGEIWVQGPGVALGYWQRATETRETFEATLASGEGPFLRTGDLGFQDGDQLYITGRLKDVILIRGKNHYPQDIERTVAACHPSLRGGAAAFAIRADQEEQLVIVAERGRQEADAAEIVQAIRQAVSNDHALQARAVVLVEQGALPRTSSGKLQRQACRAAFLTHALPAVHTSVLTESALTESTALDNDTLLTRLRSEPSPPRALLDEYVLRIVAHALHVDAGIIDSGTALTTYGLDSLAAAQLAHRIDMDLGVDIAVERVAAEMTLDQLASLIADHLAHGRRAAARLERETATDRFPASLGQAGLWFTHRTAPYSSAYNLIRALKVSGVVDLAALARACGALVERHPALRSRIVDVAGEPWQSTDVMDATGQGPLEIIDASGLSESELQARLEADANRPFDLERGPLYRFQYYDAAEPVLLLTIHHVVCDFWSFGVLIRDLIALYRATVTDSAPALPTGATHPAAYTRWERRVLAQDESRLRAFWSRQLRGAPVGTSPFATRIESKRTGLAGHTLLFRIDPATTARLREVASSGGGTVYATLLTAFATLVFRYSGQKDILIGSPVHRRGRHEFRDLVGHVFNTLVMRADLSGNPDFATALTRMRRTLSEGLQHGALPLPAVAQTIDMPRSPAGPGLFRCYSCFSRRRARTRRN